MKPCSQHKAQISLARTATSQRSPDFGVWARSAAMAEYDGEELTGSAPAAGMQATPSPSSSSMSGPAIPVVARTACECGPRKRRRSARIDLDDRIFHATRDMKLAQKQLASARAQARNEKRRKQRLVKKAAALTVQDLQRIA